MTRKLLFLVAGTLSAQTPLTVAQLYDRQLGGIERQFVPLVEAMPAEKFGFAPKGGAFEDVRTYAQQATHTAAVIHMISAAILGEKAPDSGKNENGPDSVRTKAQVVQYVKDAFAYGHKAMLAMTAENQVQMVPSPFGSGQTAKGALATAATSHSFDHYGQMVVYARMNNVVPPASQPAPPPAKKK